MTMGINNGALRAQSRAVAAMMLVQYAAAV